MKPFSACFAGANIVILYSLISVGSPLLIINFQRAFLQEHLAVFINLKHKNMSDS